MDSFVGNLPPDQIFALVKDGTTYYNTATSQLFIYVESASAWQEILPS